jgi:hypothetical protein
MKLKTYTPKGQPQEGDYRIDLHFAWCPKRVENTLIWFEHYKKVYQYTTKERITYMYGIGVIGPFTCGGWDLIAIQLINK